MRPATQCLLLATVFLLPLASSVDAPPVDAPPAAAYVRDMLDLTAVPRGTQLVEPEHLPAPSQAVGIGPGSRIEITMDGSTYGCTANFIWTSGADLFLGTAGHCLLPSDRIATHGAGADWNAANSVVDVCVADCSFGGLTGFILSGTMVRLGSATYARQTDASGDIGNDFGLVLIPPALHSYVRTSMPVWGGPTSGTNPTSVLGKTICQYGAGLAVGETWPTMHKMGVGFTTNAPEGYYIAVLGAASGDSGSPTVVCGQHETLGWHGQAALGIHTHSLASTPYKYGTQATKARAMALRDAGLSVSIVTSP